MPTLQQQIAEKFLARLADSSDVNADQVEQLQDLLETGKKIKPDDLVKVFTLPAAGDLK